MRHKYETLGIVLARAHTGEATTFLTVLTPELGLVYARAQSLRSPGAKLASSLATLAESSLVLVRGKDGWRVTGAVLEENWFTRLPNVASRDIFARVSGLLLRLVAGEERDSELFIIMKSFIEALTALPEELHEAIEVLVVLRLLAALGLDAGEIPGDTTGFSPELLAPIQADRLRYVARINTGIAASGL